MNKMSAIIEPIPLFSASSTIEEVQTENGESTVINPFSTSTVKSNSRTFVADLECFSTSEENILEGQTQTIAEVCRLAEDHLRYGFINKFLQLIHDTEFEFGFSTPVDDFVRDALEKYGPFAREWINNLFIQYFENTTILSGILRVIAHFDYHQMYPQGMTMATAATTHIDAEVRECGVRCFENWADPESLIILRNLSFSEDWLNEYLAEVISDLEDLEKNAARC